MPEPEMMNEKQCPECGGTTFHLDECKAPRNPQAPTWKPMERNGREVKVDGGSDGK